MLINQVEKAIDKGCDNWIFPFTNLISDMIDCDVTKSLLVKIDEYFPEASYMLW